MNEWINEWSSQLTRFPGLWFMRLWTNRILTILTRKALSVSSTISKPPDFGAALHVNAVQPISNKAAMNYSQAVRLSVGEEKLLTTVNLSLSARIHRAQCDQKSSERIHVLEPRERNTLASGAILQADDVSCVFFFTACCTSSFLTLPEEL